MTDEKKSVKWAPDDLSDGRPKGKWESRYNDVAAKKHIRLEAIFVAGALLVSLAILACGLYLESTAGEAAAAPLLIYVVAFGGGLLGGVLFSLKWLYHSVAHGIWNLDRRLWRLFSPLLSASLAFVFICLIQSGLTTLFNPAAVESAVTVIAVSFLIGYFSDTALAKLADISLSLFGATERHDSRAG